MKPNFYDVVGRIDWVLGKKEPTPRERNAIFELLKQEPYANYFFKKVHNESWFKKLLQKGLFHRSPGPIQAKDKKSYRIPFWTPLDYLEKISKYPEYSHDLITVMRKITESKVDNYYTYYGFTKMSINFQPEKSAEVVPLVKRWLISKFDNSLVSAELGKLLRHLLKGNQIEAALELIKIVTGTKEEKKKAFGLKEAEAIIDIYWLEELIKGNINLIIDKCPRRTINVVSQNLIEAIKIEFGNANGKTYRDGSYIWRPAIEEHIQNSRLPETKEILAIFIRDILVGMLERGDKSENILKDFINHKIPIFRRLAIFIFTRFTEELKDTAEDQLLKDEEIFSDTSVHHELYRFVKMRFGDLGAGSQEFILKSIKKGPKAIPYITPDEEKRKSKNIWMQTWLTALEGRGIKEVDDLLGDLRKKTKTKIDVPAFLVYTEFDWVEESPVGAQDILKKNNMEIAESVRDFKETESFRSHSVEGWGRALNLAVRQNPCKFEDDLTPFLTISFYYLYEIVSALQILWSENKEINWERILGFCQQLVENKTFWEPEEKGGKRSWLTRAISNLIQSGVQEDKHAFDEKYLPTAREVLVKIVRNETDSSTDLSDPVTAALNSAKGKVLSSLLSYALRYARTRYKNNIPLKKWEKEVEEVFTERLNKKVDKSLEVHTILGQNLPHFVYLDRGWVKEHLKEIFPENEKNQKYWEVAFVGYLFNSKIYKDVYVMLRGEYKRAIKTNFRDSNAQDRLGQHLCMVYLRGLEDLELENSLMRFYLDSADSIQIGECITFFRGLLREKVLSAKDKEKIVSFWKYRYGKVVQKPDIDNYRKEIFDYIELAVCVDEMDDEIYKMLKLSMQYAGAAYKTTEAIQFFKKNSPKYPKEVAELFNIMIDNCRTIPTYETKDIIGILERLYQTKDLEIKRLADRLVNKFGERGIEDFRRLYEKHKDE